MLKLWVILAALAALAGCDLVPAAQPAAPTLEPQAAQARAGVTAPDLAAALVAVLDGPKGTEVAQAAVDQAAAAPAQQRDALSTAETSAQPAMEPAANNLRERQRAYRGIYTVVVELEQRGPRLRWNMTAVVTAGGAPDSAATR